MTAKEKLRAQVDRLSEAEAAAAQIVIERAPGEIGEGPEVMGLPDAWRTFEDGTPVPNWVAGLDEVRTGH